MSQARTFRRSYPNLVYSRDEEGKSLSVTIVPVIPWHKDLEEEIRRALEQLKPEEVILDSSPDYNEPDSIYLNPLSFLGVFSEKNYTKVVKDLSEEFEFTVSDLSPSVEEILSEVSKKASIWELVRYNMFIRKIRKPKWKDVSSFLSWAYKIFYRIEGMYGEAYAFSKKVLKYTSEREEKRVVIVCDFLMLKALVEVLGHNVSLYDNYVSKDFVSMLKIVKEGLKL